MKKNLFFAIIATTLLVLTGCSKEKETKILNMEPPIPPTLKLPSTGQTTVRSIPMVITSA